MKYILYIGGAVLLAYGVKKAYDMTKSTGSLDIEIVDVDLTKFKIKLRFINVGNGKIKVDSALNTIYVNDTKIGTAKNLTGFILDAHSEKEVNFDIQTSILTGAMAGLELIKNGRNKPIIKIVSVFNSNGLIINKTTIL